jgi:spore maturation protein CgeB
MSEAGFDAELFSSNLRALIQVQRGLAQRLCRPSSDAHMEMDPWRLKLHRSSYPLALSPKAVERALTPAKDGSILVVGVGLGELVAEILALHPEARVMAWDRDPVMLRAALSEHDFAQALDSGRLRFALAGDLIGLLGQSFDGVVHHPLLAQVYRREVRLLAAGPDAPRVLMVAGGLFVDDVADALLEQGMQSFTWDVDRLTPEELDSVAMQVDPVAVFAINHTHGLAEACHRHGLSLVVWEIDPATDGLKPPKIDTSHAFIHTYRESNVDRFRAAGFANTAYTPLAANTVRRCPDASVPKDGPEVCFVGASMVDVSQRFRREFLGAWSRCFSGDPNAAKKGDTVLRSVLAAQRSRPRQYVIPQLMTQHFDAFLVQAERLLADDPVAMVAEMAAAERRLNVVARLGSEGIHVWGDRGWKATESTGVVYEGFAGHDRQLTDIYRRGRIHVDVNRLYQLDIVPMRVFDILACGGFLIAEHSPALEQLFRVGVEVESWKTVPELVAKVQHFKANPEAANRIAQAGLVAVRERHSISARVGAMLVDLAVKPVVSSVG